MSRLCSISKHPEHRLRQQWCQQQHNYLPGGQRCPRLAWPRHDSIYRYATNAGSLIGGCYKHIIVTNIWIMSMLNLPPSSLLQVKMHKITIIIFLKPFYRKFLNLMKLWGMILPSLCFLRNYGHCHVQQSSCSVSNIYCK